MTKQLKLTQVVGKKLDPNGKYMFMFDGDSTPYNQIKHFTQEMTRLLGGNNFSVTLTNGDPKKAFQVFEIDTSGGLPNNPVLVQKEEAAPKLPGFLRETHNESVKGGVGYTNSPDFPLPSMSELSENEA